MNVECERKYRMQQLPMIELLNHREDISVRLKRLHKLNHWVNSDYLSNQREMIVFDYKIYMDQHDRTFSSDFLKSLFESFRFVLIRR